MQSPLEGRATENVAALEGAQDELEATVIVSGQGNTPRMRSEGDTLEDLQLEIGSELGKFTIEVVCGFGSSSIVYRGSHRMLGRTVAIKVLRKVQFPERWVLLDHLRNEATLVAELDHPNIVRVFDFEDDLDDPYLVTEFIQGDSLHKLIQEEGSIDSRRTIRLLMQLLDALEELQKHDVLHRDIKPSNILLSMDGTAKLIDFGIANQPGEIAPEYRYGLKPPPWLGTPHYMSPEQARNPYEIDFRSDLYALGSTLFHALTGRHPFPGRLATRVIIEHIRAPRPKVIDFAPQVPLWLSNLVEKMMAIRPQDRFESYDEIRDRILLHQPSASSFQI
jgi:eukaryotic-like serine/threonine-protein kinase